MSVETTVTTTSSATDTTDAPDAPGEVAQRAHLSSRIVAIGFWLALAIPGLATLAGSRPASIENRDPAPFPEILVDQLGNSALYAAIDKAVGDAFPIRGWAVETHASIDYGLLGGSSNPAVVVAPGGWLFGADEVMPTCSFTAEETLGQIDEAAAAAERAGIGFRYVMAPDKHAIYPERLPGAADPAAMCTDQRRDAIRAGFGARPDTTVDGWTAVQEAHAADPAAKLYFESDTHWTPAGAEAVMRELVDSFQPRLWKDRQVTTAPTEPKTTDLSRQIGLPRNEDLADLIARADRKPKRSTIETGVDLDNAPSIPWFKARPGAAVIPGRTLILYNSFFARHMQLLAPWFEESVWVHADDLRAFPEIAASLPPIDNLIVQRVERSAYNLDTWELVRPLFER
jgi:hypothetical protein